MEARYNYEPIYQQVYQVNQRPIIAYDKQNEPEPLEFDKHFALICVRERSYRYNSYDAEYETLRYTHIIRCSDITLVQKAFRQQVFKRKIIINFRLYTIQS